MTARTAALDGSGNAGKLAPDLEVQIADFAIKGRFGHCRQHLGNVVGA